MIEKIILDYLTDELTEPVYMEEPEAKPVSRCTASVCLSFAMSSRSVSGCRARLPGKNLWNTPPAPPLRKCAAWQLPWM